MHDNINEMTDQQVNGSKYGEVQAEMVNNNTQ